MKYSSFGTRNVYALLFMVLFLVMAFITVENLTSYIGDLCERSDEGMFGIRYVNPCYRAGYVQSYLLAFFSLLTGIALGVFLVPNLKKK